MALFWNAEQRRKRGTVGGTCRMMTFCVVRIKCVDSKAFKRISGGDEQRRQFWHASYCPSIHSGIHRGRGGGRFEIVP